MSNLIILPNDERENGRTQDAIKYDKDCDDFQCLDDGTIVRECRYCNLSVRCQQTDELPDGTVVGMESHFLPVFNAAGVLSHELFCTGKHDPRPLKERFEDDKVS